MPSRAASRDAVQLRKLLGSTTAAAVVAADLARVLPLALPGEVKGLAALRALRLLGCHGVLVQMSTPAARLRSLRPLTLDAVRVPRAPMDAARLARQPCTPPNCSSRCRIGGIRFTFGRFQLCRRRRRCALHR